MSRNSFASLILTLSLLPLASESATIPIDGSSDQLASLSIFQAPGRFDTGSVFASANVTGTVDTVTLLTSPLSIAPTITSSAFSLRIDTTATAVVDPVGFDPPFTTAPRDVSFILSGSFSFISAGPSVPALPIDAVSLKSPTFDLGTLSLAGTYSVEVNGSTVREDPFSLAAQTVFARIVCRDTPSPACSPVASTERTDLSFTSSAADFFSVFADEGPVQSVTLDGGNTVRSDLRVVPEPSTGLLVAAGLLLLSHGRNRTRARQGR